MNARTKQKIRQLEESGIDLVAEHLKGYDAKIMDDSLPLDFQLAEMEKEKKRKETKEMIANFLANF